MSRVANNHVSADVLSQSKAVYEETRASLESMLSDPALSPSERKEVGALLDDLTTAFGDAGATKLTKGWRTKGRLRNEANAAFRTFDVQAQRIADDILVRFSHLLGDDTSTTVLGAAHSGGAGVAPGERLSNSEALALWRNDPDAFSSYFKDLSAEDRQLATMSLQDEMQAQNQIFSLISNLTQAEHQTGRALVGNIRV